MYQWSERTFEGLLHGYQRLLKLVLRFRLWAMLGQPRADWAHRMVVRHDTQRVFPRRGHRDDLWIHRGLAGCFVHRNGRSAAKGGCGRSQRPDVETAGAAIGGGASSGMNTGRLFISLKPWNERKATESEIVQRLRPELAQVPGIVTYLQPVPEHPDRRPAQSHRIPMHAAGHRYGELRPMGSEG